MYKSERSETGLGFVSDIVLYSVFKKRPVSLSLSCNQQVIGLQCSSHGNGPKCSVDGRSGRCKLVTSCKGEYSATGCPLATSLVTCCLGNDFGNINK